MSDLKDRFQCQPWYIKLWRLRYYLLIPHRTIWSWLNSGHHSFGFSFLWGLHKGMVQGDMKWYYTVDEVKERMHKRIQERSKK